MTRGLQKVRCALGTIALEWDGPSLAAVHLARPFPELPSVAGDAGIGKLLVRYAENGKPDPARSVVPLLRGRLTDFQWRVLRALQRVPLGKTCSYAALARAAGSPLAARAVGQVMRRNPWPILVPCHRVLAAAGVGGFSASGGVALKRKLLALEGVVVPQEDGC